jgi:signal transduction histidine kinase
VRKRAGLRLRLLVAAVLPAILVALALATILLDRQYRGLDEALQARARAQARQLASAAEFDVFAGSREALQVLARAAQAGDPDILAASIFDVRGQLLAVSGTTTLATPPALGWDEQVLQSGKVTVVVTLIRRSRLGVDDFYTGAEPREARSQQIDGFVVLEMSRRGLDAERNRQVLIGAGVTLAGLLLATMLALRIALGVTRPILNVGDVVDRIGQGDLTARVVPDPAGVMPGLEEGINAMARRIGYAQEYLVQQIDAATAELRQRKEEAERANRAKSRFLAAASHDLRQPLHALGLFVSRLAQLPHSSDVKPLVGHIDASVLALQDLLDTLLDISRLDAGLVTPKPADFPIADLFARLGLEFAGPAEEKHLVLRIRPSDLWLRSDPRLLARILMNFVGNALRYTSRGGVLLACRRRGNKALIQVWDTGVGIPTENLQDVFSEYVQLANPERNRAKGLGLGLAICDRLAQLLALPLGVRSIPGRGSVFWVEVPLGRVRPEAAAGLVEAPAGTHLSGTVLVIEDDTLAAAGMIELVTAGAAAPSAPNPPPMPCSVAKSSAPRPTWRSATSACATARRGFRRPALRRCSDSPSCWSAATSTTAGRRRRAAQFRPAQSRWPGKLRAVVQQILA